MTNYHATDYYSTTINSLPFEINYIISTYINIEEHKEKVFDTLHKDEYLQRRISNFKFYWKYNTEIGVFSILQDCGDDYKKEDLKVICKKYGLKYTQRMTKKQLLAKLYDAYY